MQENTAKAAAEWVFVAKSVAQMPGSESQILRCMAHAEALAKSASDWTAIAEIWALELRDSDLAQLCLSNAQSAAEDSDDWDQVADVCAELGFDETEASCRRMATELGSQDAIFTPLTASPLEASDHYVSEWAMNAGESIKHFDVDSALTYIATAEVRAKSTFDWTVIARVWSSDFYDNINAGRCLKRAEAIAEDISNWISIARYWAILLHDQKNARRCLKQAQDIVGINPGPGTLPPNAVHDWLTIVDSYAVYFYDKNNALRCMLQAEKSALEREYGDYLDWIHIAKTWRNVFRSRNNAIKAMIKAESFAYFFYDLEQVAEAWQELGHSEQAESVRDKIAYRQSFLETHDDDKDGLAFD